MDSRLELERIIGDAIAREIELHGNKLTDELREGIIQRVSAITAGLEAAAVDIVVDVDEANPKRMTVTATEKPLPPGEWERRVLELARQLKP